VDKSLPLSVLDELICNSSVINKPYPTDGQLYCNATFDGLLCYNYTLAGESVSVHCPDYPGFDTRAYARKTCMDNGQWYSHPKVPNKPWTDYTACSKLQEERDVIMVYISGYSLSIILCVLGVIIFNMFRQLKCSRVTMHQHLFISYILTGTMWILLFVLIDCAILVCSFQGWCQALHVFTQYLTVCNYCWMVCEGFYLHTLIVMAFSKEKKLLWMCIIMGWCFPFVPSAIYAGMRGMDSTDNVNCWLYESKFLWIIIGPVILSLVVNLFFLVNILRILLSKLRAFNTNEQHQNRRAAKAILILIPLLGLQYLIIPFRPTSGLRELYIFKMVSALLVSYQGVCVALIFCFFNGEVVTVVKRKWMLYRSNFDSNSSERRRSMTNSMMCNDVTLVKNGSRHNSGRFVIRSTHEVSEMQCMVNGATERV
ncbi:calcitonin receptor-like, partial [Haliotis rubra]|uniref:calcitonin receptor-like n=1 Tax=Haliotis rubra TaxID=36100 RepID=UPI001EE5B5CB